MKTKKFSITAILAVYFDNGELIRQFPASYDLIKFLAGKKDGELFGDDEKKKQNKTYDLAEKKKYNQAFDLAKKILPEQYPWLQTDVRIQKLGNRPVLDYADLSILHVVVKYRMTHDLKNLLYQEGDDLEVKLP